MGADIAMAFGQARAVWDAACDHPRTAALRLHDLAFPPTRFSADAAQAAGERLTDTRHAQPAIAAVALSQLALVRRLGIPVDMQAGHSFGEVMALHAAGVFDASTALSIACERADAMSTAAMGSSGGMLAVQASADAVMEVLGDAGHGVSLANDNAPGQAVLSGDLEGLKRAAEALSGRNIASRLLPVAAAFHSPHVGPASQPFAQGLASHALAEPCTPVYANSTAGPYPSGASALIEVLSGQIGRPVLFRQTLEAMHAAGVTTFLEVGPGSVLTGLVRQSFPADSVTAVALDDKHRNGTTSFLCAIGQLAVSGIPIDIAGLYEDLPAPPARAQPGKHSVQLLGSNYQKPYPPREDHESVRSGGDRTDLPARADRTADTAGVARAVPAARAPHPGPGIAKATDAEASPRQPSAANGSTMATPNRPSASTEVAQCRQPTSGPGTPDGNGVREEGPVRRSSVSGTTLDRLFGDVSARHGEYLAAVTATHQSYLRLAAGLIDGVDGTALAVPAEQPATPAHRAPERDSGTASALSAPAAPTPAAAPAAATSLNGLGHLNGASPAEHAATVDANPDAGSSGALAPEAPPLPAVPVETPGVTRAAGSQDGSARAGVSTDLVRELIADKTGYPAEMIEDDMDLGGELGIDSIKQVEVLSALRVQVPDIRDIAATDMGQLRTIRQIADFFGRGTTGA